MQNNFVVVSTGGTMGIRLRQAAIEEFVRNGGKTLSPGKLRYLRRRLRRRAR